jgi:hypothetical protein
LDRKIQKPYGKSNYSTLLYVNKLAKLYYGLKTTGSLRNAVAQSLRVPGDKSCSVINSLEHKLDFQVYRAGYAKSLGEARELIRHGVVSVSSFSHKLHQEPVTKIVTFPNYCTRPGEIVSISTTHTHPSVLIRCYMNYFSRLGLYSKWLLYKKMFMDACLYENMFLRNYPTTRIISNINHTKSLFTDNSESISIDRPILINRPDLVDISTSFSKSQTSVSIFYSKISDKIIHDLSVKNWHLTKAIESGIDLKLGGDQSDDKMDAKSLFEISLKKRWDLFEQKLLEFSKLADELSEVSFHTENSSVSAKEICEYQAALALLFLENQVIKVYSAMIDYTKTALLFHKWDNIRNHKINKIVEELTILKTPEGVESRINSITKEIERLEISSGIKQIGGRVVVMQPHKLEAVKKNIEELRLELEELGGADTLTARIARLRVDMNKLDKDRALQTLFPYKTVPLHYENSAMIVLPSILSVGKITRKEISNGQRTFANLLIRSLKSLNY